uniref:J domain-containing protein n=1 Tax=Octactis speculum TaxID=3111310 RepID=A0A7S2BF56_9STRA|mmetsp:Transcript_22649/g.30973  ORF Transcript_22649/g.30973 Transcript_22649/m.30973 type:complete len:581 (+) Transcript_22649:185-1927(+)
MRKIDKAHRRLCLKAHPDKGGDPALFDKIQEAYGVICSVREKEEEEKMYTALVYQATVVKGPLGIGLGLVVTENQKNGTINVTKVNPKINCKYSKESGGKIMIGDTLTAIGKDKIPGWPLNRVVERLNDFRVPVGSSILFTFSRRERVFERSDSVSEPWSPTPPPKPATNFPPRPPPPGPMCPPPMCPPPMAPPSMAPPPNTPPNPNEDGNDETWVLTEESGTDPDDLQRQDSLCLEASPIAGAPQEDSEEYTEVAYPDEQQERKISFEEEAPATMSDPVTASDHEIEMRAQIEEMKEEMRDMQIRLDESLSTQNVLEEENQQLQTQLEENQDQLTLSRAKCSSIARECADVDKSRQGAEKQLFDTQVELQHVLFNTQNYLSKKRRASTPAGKALAALTQKTNGEKPTIEEARQKALAAAIAVDLSGRVVQRWDMQDQGVGEKLKKLEERLSKMGKKGLSVPSPNSFMQPIEETEPPGSRPSLSSSLWDPVPEQSMPQDPSAPTLREAPKSNKKPSTRTTTSRFKPEKSQILFQGRTVTLSQTDMNARKKFLDARIQYRPKKTHLVESKILRNAQFTKRM